MINTCNSPENQKIVISRDLDMAEYKNIWGKTTGFAQSYFLTWQWIGTWLNVFSHDQNIRLIYLAGDKNILATFFFSVELKKRFRIIKQILLTLNTCTYHEGASTCIEYNDFLLAENEDYKCFTDKLFQALVSTKEIQWDVINIQYLPSAHYTTLKSIIRKYHLKIFNENKDDSYYTELRLLKNTSEYFNKIPKSNKINIQQNLARYYKYGEIKIRLAVDVKEALEFFSELKELNLLRFRHLKQKSVFEISKYLEFHDRLINETFSTQEISLVKIEVGGILVGIIYSFIFKNNIFFYQSGYDYSLESRLSPGIFSLFNLMKYYAQAGYEKFYFLAGNADYKRRLATGKEELLSFEIQNNTKKNKLIEKLSSLKKNKASE